MARTNKPPELKAIQGGRDRSKRNKVPVAPSDMPAVVGALGVAPAYLAPREVEVWDDVSASLPPGLLSRVDIYVLVAFCRAVAIADQAAEELRAPIRKVVQEGEKKGQLELAGFQELVVETPNGSQMQNQLIAIINRQGVQIKALGAELGLSPAARTRISVTSGGGEGDPNAHYFPAG